MKKLLLLFLLVAASCGPARYEYGEGNKTRHGWFDVSEIADGTAILHTSKFKVVHRVPAGNLQVGTRRFFFLELYPVTEYREREAIVLESFHPSQTTEIRKAVRNRNK